MTDSSASSDTNKGRLVLGSLTCRCLYDRGKSGQGGQPAAESAGGSNLTDAVTENRPPERVRVKPRGKSSRRRVATYDGDGTRPCKTKYTDDVPRNKMDGPFTSGGRLRR